MGQLKNYGNSIDVGDIGTRQSPSAPTPSTAIAPIQVRRYVRGGFAPQSDYQNRLREAANFAALYRSKQVWGGLGFDGANAPSGVSGGTAVHRFACHSGPLTHSFFAKTVLYPPLNTATQATVTLKVYSDVTMTTLVGSLPLYYGPKPSGTAFGWRMSRVVSGWIDGIAPDTDYYCSIVSTGFGAVGGMAVFDMQSLTENYNGYLATNMTMHSPILATDRDSVNTLLKSVWKTGGSHVLNWSTVSGATYNNDDGSGHVGTDTYITSISTTLTNIIDRTSTTVSANTPGYTLDMAHKDRVSQTSGVPCVLKAWGYGATGNSGTVVIKNSAGTTIATLVCPNSATPIWNSVTFNLPATVDKYDVQFKSANSSRFYLGAVSCWEQE